MTGTGFTLLNYPRQAHVGSVVHKRKIYEHSNADTALKNLFVQQVEQIIWGYKLAPETINLPSTEAVSEIQVFRISLKSSQLDHRVLQAIDKAIPFPILFEVSYRGQTRLVAAYKRPHENDRSRWVISRYFESDWQPQDAPRAPLPVALNMEALYERLLEPLVAGYTASLLPDVAEPPVLYAAAKEERPESLEKRIAQAEAIERQAREVERIKARLAREKQFNKRVAINAELRAAKQILNRLISDGPQRTNSMH